MTAANLILSRDEKISRAACEVAWLEALHDGLANGTVHWSAWRDDLLCPNRAEVAIDECWHALMLAKEDLAALLRERAA